MKVPPKRKGNHRVTRSTEHMRKPLNESPSEKEGKYCGVCVSGEALISLNESPSEKEGK